MSSSCKTLLRIILHDSRQAFRQIIYKTKKKMTKFSDKKEKIEESGVRDIHCFQGGCEEEGVQNLKRIKQILSELYFPELRQVRQVT